MKHCTFILISIVITLNFACSAQKSAKLQEKSDEVVLEIITTAHGMAYPKEGDLLDMRLYESGRFEYDDYPDYNPPQASSRNVTVTKKEAKLSLEDVAELTSLAEQPDFLSAREEYPDSSTSKRIDDGWITTIKFVNKDREKKIVAVNFLDILYDAKKKSEYPLSMVKLFERAEDLKAKVIGKPSKYLAPSVLSNNLMDVRAKQRLSYHVVLFP